MGKNKRVFENSVIIILMMVCVILTVILLQIIVDGEKVNKEQLVAGLSGNEEEELTEQIWPMNDDKTTAEIQKAEEDELGNVMTESGLPHIQETAGEGIMPEEIQEDDTERIYEFTAGDRSYFDDALFIGDSRTVGLREFGTLDNADYFASSGLNLYTIDRTKAKYGEAGEIGLEELLAQNTYGKIYVMLGINELGYDFDTTVEKYRLFLERLQESQPGAILFVCANLHVNSVRNEVDEIHNNHAINRINQEISCFADQKNIFYLDVNPLFDDEFGNLGAEYISDDSHLLGKYYETWCDWYCNNTIVKE